MIMIITISKTLFVWSTSDEFFFSFFQPILATLFFDLEAPGEVETKMAKTDELPAPAEVEAESEVWF